MDMAAVAKMMKGEGDERIFLARWDRAVEFSFVALKDLGEIRTKIVKEGRSTILRDMSFVGRCR